jgi:hypothetical protein
MKYRILATMAKTNPSDDSGCSGGSCPTFYQTEEGKIYVQGTKILDSDKVNFTIPYSEDIIEIPTELLDKLRMILK